MSDRSDFLKSLVRGAAGRVSERVARLPSLAAAKRALVDAVSRRATIDDTALASMLARVRGVDGASVASRGGAVRIDATFSDGAHVAMSLVPSGATFAPRGAKEIRFRVEPKEIAISGHCADLAAAVAGAVARVMFGPFMPGTTDFGGAMVDREGDLFRIDLRTIPAIRSAATGGPLATLFDAIEPGEIVAEEGRLRVQLKLPTSLRP